MSGFRRGFLNTPKIVVEMSIQEDTKIVPTKETKSISMKKEDFESLCNRIFKERRNPVLEIFKNCDVDKTNVHNFEYLMNKEIESHKDFDQILEMLDKSEEICALYASLLRLNLTSMLKEHMKMRREKLPKMPIEEFSKLATELFVDLNKESNVLQEKLDARLLTMKEVQNITEESMYRHKFYAKLNEMMGIDEAYKQLFNFISLRISSKSFRENNKRNCRSEKSKSLSEMKILCHRVFEECYNRVLEKINNVNDRTILNMKDYENVLTLDIYTHKDIAQFMRILDGLFERGGQSDAQPWKLSDHLIIFDSLIVEYSNKLMKEHKKKWELDQSKKPLNTESRNSINESVRKSISDPNVVVPEQLPKNEQKRENMNEKKDGESTQELMRKIKELENQLNKEHGKYENLRKEKEKSENFAKKMEKTMEENVKKEKEISKNLADDLKIEKENSQRISESLEIEKRKLENMKEENQNYNDSLKWYKSELEKSERLVEDLQEKRENEKKEHEQMASKMAEMEEFQRINNKETEEWKSQIMKLVEKQAEELKMAKLEIEKYEERIEKAKSILTF